MSAVATALLIGLGQGPGGARAAAPAIAPAPTWPTTLDRVVPAVVSLRTNATRAFDTVGAATSVATGFIVDADRGLILTNRHVAGPGPSVIEAVFLDNEELPVQVVYRDPVHDFAILRFDPTQLRFMKAVDLSLCADCAAVGMEVRVVGNDAGEKLSILPGTIARLDRDAPGYGPEVYNDFNTFYIQSAAGTSGGSSGSPVLQVDGQVVALNAGARRQAASSYFLPLHRVVRALRQVQAGQPVRRGTVQVVLGHATYDEVRRLGVDEATEARTRAAFPAGNGLLTVKEVVPGGPADGWLRPGDVLLELDGRPINGFVDVEALLDDNVGQELGFKVLRGGSPVEVVLAVGDLDAITPDNYLEFGGGLLNPVGYQQARNHGLPARGAVVTSAGYAFGRAGIPAGALILQVGAVDTPDLDAVESALSAWPDGARVPVRYSTLNDARHSQLAIVPIDRRWNPMQRCRLSADTGDWPCEPSASPTQPLAAIRGSSSPLVAPKGPARQLAPAIVEVDFDIPFRTDGVYASAFRGAGLVVDAERGLVVVDRDTVPVALGDVSLTFGGSVQIPAQVAWLHPEHNLAFLRYDPALVASSGISAVRFDPRPLSVGDGVWQVGIDGTGRVAGRKTAVARVRPVDLPLPRPPFFRDTNLATVQTEGSAASIGGALVSRSGQVQALWASFVELDGDKPSGRFAGLPARTVVDALDHVVADPSALWPALGAELVPVAMTDARDLGLGDADAAALGALSDERRVLGVQRLTRGSPAAASLQEGDLILSLNGRSVVHYADFDAAIQDGPLRLRVLRQGAPVDVEVAPHGLSGLGTRRVLGFAGTLLQESPDALAAQRGLPQVGVYVAWYWYGSPAARYGLRPTRRIVAIDGVATPDLDALLAAVKGRADRSAVRLTTRDLDDNEDVITLKLDNRFWPAFELQRGEDGAWRRIEY